MKSLLFYLAVGIVLTGLVHLGSLLALPGLSSQGPDRRLAALAPFNTVVLLPDPAPERADLAFADPAFVVAVCRFDLTGGPVILRFETGPVYASVSFYSPTGVAFSALNDRAATRGVIELDLMASGQRPRVSPDAETTRADRLIVDSPVTSGLAVIRLMAGEPSLRPALRERLAAARCARSAAP
jgi:uncharacterized membrane protein